MDYIIYSIYVTLVCAIPISIKYVSGQLEILYFGNETYSILVHIDEYLRFDDLTVATKFFIVASYFSSKHACI